MFHCLTNVLTLLWRHNGCDSVSNHQPHHCLLNRLFRRRSKKTSKLRVTGLCAGIHRGPVNSPHKWPVTRKMFPFDDVIMNARWSIETNISEYSSQSTSTLIVLCCALLWLGNGQFYPYHSGSLHWHWDNLWIVPVPVKQPWMIWVNNSSESHPQPQSTMKLYPYTWVIYHME